MRQDAALAGLSNSTLPHNSLLFGPAVFSLRERDTMARARDQLTLKDIEKILAKGCEPNATKAEVEEAEKWMAAIYEKSVQLDELPKLSIYNPNVKG